MRCLTLANKLKENRIDVTFVCKNHPGNISEKIAEQGFRLIVLPPPTANTDTNNDESNWLGCTQQDDAQEFIDGISSSVNQNNLSIDLLIVDHYSLDKTWHQALRPYCKKLVVIDDLANRPYDCDILLDQTFNRSIKNYQHLTPQHCQLLLGKKYMLLRNEFTQLHTQSQQWRTKQSQHLFNANILISMGGTDPDNISELALMAIKNLQISYPNITATLVLSSHSKHLAHLTKLQAELAWCQLITDSQSMATLMLNADIAIGASGSTAWERCCLGLPSLLSINAQNQKVIAENLTKANGCINLGWHEKMTINSIMQELERLLNNPALYLNMVNQCLAICDGQGTTRAVENISNMFST